MALEFPLVTIITPSLNMGQFIERTLESVMAQDYPNIEYLVLDGGSTDGTLEILERFADLYPARFRYISERDEGAAAAITRGFSMARGEIFAYLNADDVYLPGALRAAVSYLQQHAGVAGVYGKGYWISEAGERIGDYPTRAFDAEALGRECFICQPACFVRTAALRAVGGFNPKWETVFDYDVWLRLACRSLLLHVEDFWAESRMHASNKTLSRRKLVFQESIACVRSHQGYVPFQWVHGYCSYLLDRRDQFFEPLRPSFTKFAFSLLLGTLINWRRPVRYWREWARVMSPAAFIRRWNATWIARRIGWTFDNAS